VIVESRILRSVARRPLAAGLALAFSLSAVASSSDAAIARSTDTPPAPRGAIVVSNCDDDGPGSLRAAVAAAASGNTIDLTTLGCSTITLTTGYIAVAQDDLSIQGPGSGSLTIDAGYASGIMRHSGAGTLSISRLSLVNGTHTTDTSASLGGCLYSAANLEVVESVVSTCTAHGTAGNDARGGAIYTLGNLTLASSIVTNSRAYASAVGRGGGVYVAGDLDAESSSISYNAAQGAPIVNGQGGGAIGLGTTTLRMSSVYYNGAYEVGGLWTFGAVTIDASLIARNGASQTAGMRATDGTGSATATIVNSTIAYNHSVARVGGLNLIVPATIRNTTIASNEAFNGLAGVLMSGPTLELDSTIIAGNMAGPTEDDFEVYGSPVITGASNLVIATSATLPPDTIADDPLLGPLTDNGGLTLTMALMPGSPAIDAGNNVAALADDQRGTGFLRHVGVRTDIGAFEVQDPDFLFSDGFDAD